MYRTTVFEAAKGQGWDMPELARRTGLPIWTLRNLKRRGGIGMHTKTIEGIRRAFPNLMFEHLFVEADCQNLQPTCTDVESPAVGTEGQAA